MYYSTSSNVPSIPKRKYVEDLNDSSQEYFSCEEVPADVEVTTSASSKIVNQKNTTKIHYKIKTLVLE